MPRGRYVDPYAAQRADLAQRKFAQSVQTSSDRTSLSQESNLLHKAQMVFEVVKARQAIEQKRDEVQNAAAIVQKIGSLATDSPTYWRDRAQILSDHAPGMVLAGTQIAKMDSVAEAYQKGSQMKAEAFAPANVGKAAYDLTTAVKAFDSLAGQFTKKGQPVPPALQAAKTNFTNLAAQIGEKATTTIQGYSPPQSAATQALAAAPAATAALQSAPAQPQLGASAAQPAPAGQPAAPTPAATIATDDATKFLQSIGVGTPAPQPAAAAAAAAQPVQAAQSGLPDEAEQAVSPSDDENEDQ